MEQVQYNLALAIFSHGTPSSGIKAVSVDPIHLPQLRELQLVSGLVEDYPELDQVYNGFFLRSNAISLAYKPCHSSFDQRPVH